MIIKTFLQEKVFKSRKRIFGYKTCSTTEIGKEGASNRASM